jgi:hypothetical protein
VDIDYVITGSPSLIKAKNKRYCTYKTTAALKVEAKDGYLTSIAKNELTLMWTVEMKETKKESKIKSIQLASVKAKPVSGFFEYEKQQIQETAKGLIEQYYQNILLEKWKPVLTPDIPNRENVKAQLENNVKIEAVGDILIPLSNSLDIIVGEEYVPFLNLYTSDNVTDKNIFALTFNIKIDDNLQDGEITKVVYRLSSTPPEKPIPTPEPEPEKEVQPEIKEVGMTYKVQILALFDRIPLAELSAEYRNVENVVIEESVIEGKTYYQYVIPAGNNSKDAQA